LILLAVFIVDATVTLARRFIVGGKWYQAHRSHGYQRLSRRFKSHGVVTLGVLRKSVSRRPSPRACRRSRGCADRLRICPAPPSLRTSRRKRRGSPIQCRMARGRFSGETLAPCALHRYRVERTRPMQPPNDRAAKFRPALFNVTVYTNRSTADPKTAASPCHESLYRNVRSS
jgi:hypothetical protein